MDKFENIYGNSIDNKLLADQSTNGLMSSADKKKLDEFEKLILDKTYPIGSIYISVNNINPENIIGGVWEPFGKGRTIFGVDETQTEFDTVNKIGGEKNVSLDINNLPSHNHGGYTNTVGNHSHNAQSESNGVHTHGASTNSTGAHTHSVSGTANSAGAHTHKALGATEKSGGSNGFMMAYNNYSWRDGHIESNGAHTHSVSGTANSAGAHTHSVSISNSGSHNHTISVDINGNHSHSLDIYPTGDNQAHNNLPPYISVYMYKRIL